MVKMYKEHSVMGWKKKLNLELASTRNIVKLTEATRTNIGLQEFILLQSLFTGALLNGIENSQSPFTRKSCSSPSQQFVQPPLERKNEMEKQRKEIKELWKQQQNKMLKQTALKAKLLCMQYEDENEYARFVQRRSISAQVVD